MIIDLKSDRFMYVAVGQGRQHDLSLFRASRVRLRDELLCLADKGDQGIAKLHSSSHTPCKGAARVPYVPLRERQSRP